MTSTDPIPPTIRADIDRRLAAIEAEHGVRYLLAVESGSRAWGFPSPDSDYDVRFIHVHPRDWYLSLKPGRDVIETPIEDDIDLNGWDVRQALGLMLKSNAVVSEWLASPIRYRPDDPAAQRLAALADAIFDPRGMAHHYANLGRNSVDRWMDGDGPVPVKRYFYALRPALAIRALRCHPQRRPAMNLQALMDECALAPALGRQINELVAAKRETRELGNTRWMPELDALIREELARVDDVPRRRVGSAGLAEANAIFLDLVAS